MLYSDYFPKNYTEARERFRKEALRVGCKLLQYPISAKGPNGEELTIDVAIYGTNKTEFSLVVSSGLHGVEGLFGTAIQLAILNQVTNLNYDKEKKKIVFINSINPYGYSWIRRTNEDNIDLNRNFLNGDEKYEGSTENYRKLEHFLNPKSTPSDFEPYKIKALYYVLRYGLRTLKNSIAVGQYEFPKGLFFGGHQESESTKIIKNEYHKWIKPSKNITHLDFHSGLGKFSDYKLLVLENKSSELWGWYGKHFGFNKIDSINDGVAYPARGMMGSWLKKNLYVKNFRYLAPEFGTFSEIRILENLRKENQAHFFSKTHDRTYKQAKEGLIECFCPSSPRWRQSVVKTAMVIASNAINADYNTDLKT